MFSITRPYGIYLISGFVSILLSCWISGSTSVINPDAICYLQSAAVMHEGLSVAMNLCDQAKWPFYSILIAGFVELTKLSFETSAYILNGIFSLLTVLVFIGIIHFLSKSTSRFNASRLNEITLLSMAAVVILLVNEFNSIKHYIIRDHGFWAFYLLSILLLMCYFRFQKWYFALGWSVSIIIATLFRIEGAIFLLIMPCLAFIAINERFVIRLKAFMQLNAITILIGVFLLYWLFYTQQSIGRLSEIEFQLSHGVSTIVNRFTERAHNLGVHVLNTYSARDSKLILSITITAWYFTIVLANLSFVYMGLLIYSWYKRLLPAEKSSRMVLWSYIIINISVTAFFLAQNMFLSKRYMVALSLVLMLWIPFALENLIMQWRLRHWPILLAMTMIFIASLGGIFEFGHSKKYIHDAGTWIANHAAPNEKIYSNDPLVMYYTNRFGDQIFEKIKQFSYPGSVEKGQWKQHDYLVLRTDKKNLDEQSGILQELTFEPIKVFSNKRGDQVRIYQVPT